jgi:D-sedoheptulose 7-phosphate isomerase
MKSLSSEKTPLCVSPQVRTAMQYFQQYSEIVPILPYDAIEKATGELLRGYDNGRCVFLFGNGGSAALASHFACDLSKGTVLNGNGHKRFRVLALTDNLPLVTAWANDTSYDQVFAEQLRNFVSAGDVVFAISGSGNSPNVLHALMVSRDAGAFNIGLTGFQGGKMRDLCDVCIVIPSENMQIIEDLHVSVAHAVFSVIRQRLFDDKHAASLTGPQVPTKYRKLGYEGRVASQGAL